MNLVDELCENLVMDLVKPGNKPSENLVFSFRLGYENTRFLWITNPWEYLHFRMAPSQNLKEPSEFTW